MTWQRANKDKAREYVTSLQSGRRAKCVLLLPGQGLLCLRALIKNKTVSRKTRVVLVEKDPKVAAKIDKELNWYRADGYNQILLIKEDLWKIDMRSYLPTNGKFDYCYLDTCSCLTESAMEWIFYSRKLFTRNAWITISLCTATRYLKLKKLLLSLGKTLLTKKERNNIATVFGHLGGPEVVSHGIPIMPKVYEEGMATIAILKDLLGRQLDFCFFYRDLTTYMLTCCFRGVNLPS